MLIPKSDLNLVTIGGNSHEDLPEISLDSQWHIELTGSPNEYVMIILQSKDIFYQLAPIDTEGCDNIFKIRKMRYPQQKPLFFDKDYGTGRRQLIAVRAKYMDCQVKNLGTTHICSLEELNQFAIRTINKPGNSISVDRYAFMLV